MSILKIKDENNTWQDFAQMAPQDVVIEDNLTSTSAISALSANQGRVLDDKITDLSNDLSYMTTTVLEDNKLNADASMEGSYSQSVTLRNLIDWYNVQLPRRAYNGSTGAPTWFKIMNIGATGGYGDRYVTFLIEGYNTSTWALATFAYYNNANIKAYYVHKTGNITLGYYKNSDNTIDIYYHNDDYYAPASIKILSAVSGSSGFFNPYLNNTLPTQLSSTPTYTSFSSLL